MSSIIQFDQQLFLWIQHHCHTTFLDVLFTWFRHKESWYPLYAVIIIVLIVKYRWVGLRIILIGVLSLALSDGMSSHIVKPLFKRTRPCSDTIVAPQFTPTIDCSSGYSFTSSHAANHFGIVFALCLFFYKRKRWILWLGILWAGSISFAQVYVGVHYPIDISGGAVIGISISLFIHWVINKYFPNYFILT
jgi:membrane-associated phospholipid phosphatase